MTERPDIDAIERDHRPWQLTPSCAPMVSQLCAYVRELEAGNEALSISNAVHTQCAERISELEKALQDAIDGREAWRTYAVRVVRGES